MSSSSESGNSHFTAGDIPGLTPEEEEVYKTLYEVRDARARSEHYTHIPNVVVVTDIAKDYDDLVAVILLKELHRIGLIKIIGLVANFKPTKIRAEYARGALDTLGLSDIPVTYGIENSDPLDVASWEFKGEFVQPCTFTPEDETKIEREKSTDEHELESGMVFLERVVGESKKNDLTFLCISYLADMASLVQRVDDKHHTGQVGLEDIGKSELFRDLMENTEDTEDMQGPSKRRKLDRAILEEKLKNKKQGKLASVIRRVVMQGGYSPKFDTQKLVYTLEPDNSANNKFDFGSAVIFHEFLAEHNVPAVVYNKGAATACGFPQSLFVDLSDTGHVLGRHLYIRQGAQDLTYYMKALHPETRFQGKTQEDFLKTRTNWYEIHPEGDDTPIPIEEEVLQYVKIILYDVLAALDTAGPDVREALDVLEPATGRGNIEQHLIWNDTVGPSDEDDFGLFWYWDHCIRSHEVVGGPTDKPSLDMSCNVPKMQVAISALLKGSLITAVAAGHGRVEDYPPLPERE